FGLREFITFNKKVEFVNPAGDNKWQVKFADGQIKLYKGVLVCNGHHWDKRYPVFEGSESFKGEIFHSKDYKTPDQLKGKNVVVVGAGNSACDVASEAARVGASSYISIRSSAWFLPKLVAGYPLSHFAKNWLPPFIQRTMLKIGLRLTVGDLSRYGLPKPDHDILTKHPTIGTEALHYIKHGKLTPKPGISRISEDEVEFIDGTKVKADLIVTATGFHLSYPFLPKELHRTKGAFAQVYGRSMLADFKGIYLIG
ncbi:MAG: NAD(P)/FAD-dependent oxidoreductase, partial [Sphingobacteriales bacterium]